MASLEELNLNGESLPSVDLGKLPEQAVGEYYTPQPGDYTWKLPDDCSSLYEKIATDNGQRIKAKFVGKHTLVATNGARLMVDISNMEFKDKDGNPFSDFAYLLRALDFDGRLDDNSQYITALTNSAGKLFKAEVVWKGKSRATGQAFRQRAVKFTKGPMAGKEWLAIPKIGNQFQETFEWEGEQIRCFPSLKNFRKAE